MDDYEEWEDIPGYVGLYQASSHGRIRSVRRLLQSCIDMGLRIHKKILSPGTGYAGRLGVILSKPAWLHEDPGIRRHQVHRLVYAAFNGPVPDGLYILHIDGDHLNNREDNLYAGTQLQNMQDKRRHGTQTEGENHGPAKLTEEQARRIKFGNERQIDLAKEFGVTQVAISLIRTGKNWKHLMPNPDTQPTTVPALPGLFD